MLMRGWTTDLKHVCRRLQRAPGFAAVAIASLALGIGATSTIFTLAYAVWLRPLPYRDADALVTIQQRHTASGAVASLSGPDLADYRSGARSFTGLAAFSYGAQIARIDGERRRIQANPVSPNLFDVLGASPAIGRTFVPADVGAHVAVLSYTTWMTQFGGDPRILSRQIELTSEPYSIIGVMPRGFRFPQILEAEIWIPSDYAGWIERGSRYLQAVARLRPDTTVEHAGRDVALVAASIASANPATSAGWTAEVVPLDQRDGYGATFSALLGIVGLFLLVGCANVAGLLIARNVDRRGELAVCASLGASRSRLGRQMTIEAGVLAIAGGGLGLLLASVASRALASVLPTNVPGAADVRLDFTVIGFSIALSALTAIVAGLIPVFGIGSISASEALTGARRTGPRSHRLHTALVVGEVAAAMTLVLGASLMATSFAALLGRDRGFDPHGVLALNVSLPFEQDRYENPAVRAEALDRIVGRVIQLPGVTSAGATNGFPGSALGVLGTVLLKPQIPEATREVQGVLRSATPDYFKAMGVVIKSGRPFTAADTAAAPRVAIINETLARAMWRDGDAIGRVLPLPSPEDPTATLPWTVVGVAIDMRLGTRAPADIFLPVAQRPAFWIDLVMRTSGDPAALAPVVRRALRDLDSDFLIENSRSIDAIIANRLGLERAQSVFATVIASLSAVVAGVGLYALLSFAVAQRTREFAIRLALGSAPRALFGSIFFRGLRLAAIGVVLGAAATFGLIRLLRSQVFGLDAASPWAFAISAFVLLAIAALALLAPARRVLRAQAIAAIRQ